VKRRPDPQVIKSDCRQRIRYFDIDELLQNLSKKYLCVIIEHCLMILEKGMHKYLRVTSENLRFYPTNIEAQENKIVIIGDLHGNAMKLIYQLIKYGIMKIDKDFFNLLWIIYERDINKITVDDLEQFEYYVSAMEVHIAPKLLVMIGDEFADRGQNDYFTALVLQKLHDSAVAYKIYLSNHGAHFISWIENQTNVAQKMPFQQALSLDNLRVLISKLKLKDAVNITEKMHEMFESAYIEHLMLIGYIQENDAVSCILTHAPIDNIIMKELASTFGVNYNIETGENIAACIDQINAHILDDIKESKFTTKYLRNHDSAVYKILWNRALPQETLPAKIINIHGHVGEKPIHKHPEDAYINLDSDWGKPSEEVDHPLGGKYSFPPSHIGLCRAIIAPNLLDLQNNMDNGINFAQKTKSKRDYLNITREDLSVPPTKIESQEGQVVIVGDLHGNTMKLIHLILRYGIMDIHPDVYNELWMLYNGNTNLPLFNVLERFEICVNTMTIARVPSCLIFLGNELADRGKNDYFTAMVLQKLHDWDIPYKIQLSNHGSIFIAYRENKLADVITFPFNQIQSLYNFMSCCSLIPQSFLESVVQQEFIRKMDKFYREAYVPHLMLLGYVKESDAPLCIITHAPIDNVIMKGLATIFNVNYNAETGENITECIDEINQKVVNIINNNMFTVNFTALNNSNNAVYKTLWNRKLPIDPLPAGIVNVHGHVEECPEVSHIKNAYISLYSHWGKPREACIDAAGCIYSIPAQNIGDCYTMLMPQVLELQNVINCRNSFFQQNSSSSSPKLEIERSAISPTTVITEPIVTTTPNINKRKQEELTPDTIDVAQALIALKR
jgi:hypothetical protein